MKSLNSRPGVLLLPVLIISVIFLIVLILLLDQKKINSEIALEYRASRIITLLINLYNKDENIEPADLDRNIKGFGIYDLDGSAVFIFGSAPDELPEISGTKSENVVKNNRSVVIIRWPRSGYGGGPLMGRFPDPRGRRADTMPQTMMMPREYAEPGIYMEYRNSGYASELKLLVLITILFAGSFGITFYIIFRLYRSNRKLLLKSEHDKQLIQLGEAARTLAHEIRNPLSALKIQRDLLKKKLPSEYHGNLEVIDRELKRLNTLVDKVGEFLRNPIGAPEIINISEFSAELYSERADVIISSLNDGAAVFFDRERLRTVLDNLVNNAVEAGGKADLRIESDGKNTVVRISDNGPGLSEESFQRMFDPFYTTKNSGTGLGLSVVKRLIEAAGGEVSISNLKEGGASVRLHFRETSRGAD